eukprot:1049139-Prorocentrum_minimum.AAC.1
MPTSPDSSVLLVVGGGGRWHGDQLVLRDMLDGQLLPRQRDAHFEVVYKAFRLRLLPALYFAHDTVPVRADAELIRVLHFKEEVKAGWGGAAATLLLLMKRPRPPPNN